MDYKDYYKVLGIDRKADEDQIKRAYRKLALQYHPDRNPGDSTAEDKFKDINEAYQVLSDPEKKSRYDALGESYNRYQQRGGTPGSFNWEDWYSTGYPGGNVHVETGGVDDFLRGGFSEFFTRIFGGNPNFGGSFDFQEPSRTRSRMQKPSYQQELEISMHESYHGTKRMIEIDGKRLEVKIPRGAKTGTRVRVPDVIATSSAGQKGDLFLVIKVADDPRYKRKGDNLYMDVPVELTTAVLGGEVMVETLSGNVVLTIPAGTQPGQTFRLAGRGMPSLKQADKSGDLLVQAKIKIPKKLTESQRKKFEDFAHLVQE
jgi:curved DNA-binding protein